MVKEVNVNDNEDTEPSVCETNGMIPMHEQSEVIRISSTILVRGNPPFPFLFLPTSVKIPTSEGNTKRNLSGNFLQLTNIQFLKVCGALDCWKSAVVISD